MLDDDNTNSADTDTGSPESGAPEAPPKKAAARKAAPRKAAAKKAPAKRTTKKVAAVAEASTEKAAAASDGSAASDTTETGAQDAPPAKKAAARKTTTRKTAAKTTTRRSATKKVAAPEPLPLGEPAPERAAEDATAPDTAMLFQAPEPTKPVRRTRRAPAAAAATDAVEADAADAADAASPPPEDDGTAQVEAGQVEAGQVEKPKAKKAGGKSKSKKTADGAPAEPAEKATESAADGDSEGAASADDSEGSAPRKSGKGKGSHNGSNKAKNGKSGSKTKSAKNVADEDESSTDGPAGADVVTEQADDSAGEQDSSATSDTDTDNERDEDSGESSGGPRRRRRRGGRRRRKGGEGDSNDSSDTNDATAAEGSEDADSEGDSDNSDDSDDASENGSGGTRRRRRRRRAGESGGGASDDPENTVTRVRQGRTGEDQITAVSGSTRLEAKKQRRREGREAGRRRAPIVSEAEFLARRESVERVMVIRQRPDLTQIAVLEDKVLVEHYVARESQTSLIGNVYVGRVQNVLPSMEAAFVDIGKGRNAVIYAGEINWAALGHKDGQPRKIESVLSSGQSILVQVTKDPIGHKGARLTGQVSLAGRFLVYVPDGTTSGISRKLPDTERSRLKALLKEIVPDTAGVIVRTAAEGASEEELTQDVARLKARWEEIEAKTKSGNSPKLLYGEPDLTLKVVRDLFTEDFAKLVIEGDDAWETVQNYVSDVAPDLGQRLERYESQNGKDSFAAHRIEEQIAKGLDRKVWLPSGGSLIIDRTEAMTVVDVNTGKFTGSGGNLEETVTKNNLEAAEEIVRQLRLRDIGGIIVVDFIDMVLESNRDLVLRRLVECLGRDRTRHQVAEVTSLGLIQMTRKRIGTGLLEAFSEDCEHCQGRGVMVQETPVEPKHGDDDRGRSGGRRSRGRGKGEDSSSNNGGEKGGSNNGRQTPAAPPSPKDVAAVAKPENADRAPIDEVEAPVEASDSAETQQPAVVTTTRRQSGRRGSGRSGRTPADSTADSAPQEPSSASQVDAPVETAAESATVSTDSTPSPAPKVVTRTRRRASRPAGVHTTAVVEALTVKATDTEQPVVVEPVAAPTVVTRTRSRRGATRPAGAGSTGAATGTGAGEGDQSADQGPVES